MKRRTLGKGQIAESSNDGLKGSRLRLMGVAILCLKVALVPLVFDATSDVPFAVAKGLVSHALAYALVGLMIGLIVLYGRSVFVRSWIHFPVAAYLVVSVLATLFAADSVLA